MRGRTKGVSLLSASGSFGYVGDGLCGTSTAVRVRPTTRLRPGHRYAGSYSDDSLNWGLIARWSGTGAATMYLSIPIARGRKRRAECASTARYTERSSVKRTAITGGIAWVIRPGWLADRQRSEQARLDSDASQTAFAPGASTGASLCSCAICLYDTKKAEKIRSPKHLAVCVSEPNSISS